MAACFANVLCMTKTKQARVFVCECVSVKRVGGGKGGQRETEQAQPNATLAKHSPQCLHHPPVSEGRCQAVRLERVPHCLGEVTKRRRERVCVCACVCVCVCVRACGRACLPSSCLCLSESEEEGCGQSTCGTKVAGGKGSVGCCAYIQCRPRDIVCLPTIPVPA